MLYKRVVHGWMSVTDIYRLSASNRTTTAGHVYYLAERGGGGKGKNRQMDRGVDWGVCPSVKG